MAEIRFTIPLQPRTKKNSMRIFGNRLMPSKAFMDYQDAAGIFLKGRGRKLEKPCQVKALFYMGTRRLVDLTNLEEALDDILVHYGVLADDNSRILFSHDGSRVLYDKQNPRTEVKITWEESTC